MQRLIPLEIVVGVVLGIIFGFIALEYIIMGAIIIMIFTTETINSAIEEVNDLVTDQINEKVKRSKDMASASVWTWHLVYIICVLVFLVMHIAHFAWWAHIIPS